MDERPPREPAEPGPEPGWYLAGPAPLAHPPAVRHATEPPPGRGTWDTPGAPSRGSGSAGPSPGDAPGGPPRSGASAWAQLRAAWAAGGGHGPSRWRRVVRTPRAAAGLGILAAALLLWPFSGWAGLPWFAGLGALVLLALLRLDRLLRGWTWHLAGLVVVAGLMYSTGPWAWALAASIGVLLAGLVQLPAWRVAAVGAVLVAVAATGFAIAQYRTAEQIQAQQAQTQVESRGRLGAPRPAAVLPTLLTTIGRGETGAVCDALLDPAAQPPFAASVGQPDCAAAVRALAAQVTDANAYAKGSAPPGTHRGAEFDVDACHLTWRASTTPPGPQLGHLTVGPIPGGTTYAVTAFRPC
ncbi:MAG: hypothetical protein AB7V44_22175 [Pseudonocardia sp.]